MQERRDNEATATNVMITGAGGSIGGEALDLVVLIGSVRDSRRITQVFEIHKQTPLRNDYSDL